MVSLNDYFEVCVAPGTQEVHLLLVVSKQMQQQTARSNDSAIRKRSFGSEHLLEADFVVQKKPKAQWRIQWRNTLRLIRLVEANLSQRTDWKGVSILFGSPGLKGMTDYEKVDTLTYITSVWTLDELQEYNSIIFDKLKLEESVLIERYDKFGGIPPMKPS